MARKVTKGFDFNAIEEDAGIAELLKIKAALMDCIRDYIAEVSQAGGKSPACMISQVLVVGTIFYLTLRI